jgi:PilZ domain
MENRRSRRKPVQQGIEVTDALSGQVVGQVGNLSVDGMLLIANRELPENALFQFRFDLPTAVGAPHRFEIGVHEQWGEPASVPGQFWFGFRIIDIAPEDRTVLAAWVDTRDDTGF